MLSAALLRRVAGSDLPPAVVVGTGITGLSLARALRSHGVPVIGIDCRKRRYSSYSGAFQLLLVDRETFYGEGLVAFLQDLARELPRKPALFLSMDEQVKVVGAHGQGLGDVYHFEFPSQETVELLMNKEAFHELAGQHGWLVPETYSCRSLDELAEFSPKLQYPVILKPRTKNLAFRRNAPKKAFRCADRDELIECYTMIAPWEPEAIVQQWIPGGDDQVHFSFHYFDSALEEICSFVGRKIRQYQPECGSTSSAVGVHQDGLAESARHILTTAGCVGFGSVEYKRHSGTGDFYVTEPTVGRPNLQLGVALANGVDIVSRAYFHMIGQAYPLNLPRSYHKKWIILRSDLRSARYYVRESQLTWLEYLRSLRGPKTFAVWRVSDYRMLLGFFGVWLSAPVRLVPRLTDKIASTFVGGAPERATRQNGGPEKG